MLKFIPKLPLYYFARTFNFRPPLPISLTLSISYHCNARCKTCNIYKKQAVELTTSEWQSVFRSIGQDLFWATVSGGEPFLKDNLEDLVCALYDCCQPSVINIPTNGLLTDCILLKVKKIVQHCKKTDIVINVSIDDIGEKHDLIRGIPGSYQKALDTFLKLKALNSPNLSVGIHTVISRFNVNRIPAIYNRLIKYGPDSYITEMAEERVELDTIGAGISPMPAAYGKAVDFLIEELKRNNYKKIGKITRAFRIEYYKMVKNILKTKSQAIPCYSGIASAQIAPDGDVWGCCVKAEPIGNLRTAGYDLKKIWLSEEAKSLRHKIKSEKCFCPLANASYTNMLLDLKSVLKVGKNLV